MKLLKKTIKFFNQSIIFLENSKTSVFYLLTTFFFALTLRNFLEIFSDKTSFFQSDIFFLFIHYYSFYTSLAITLILLFHLLTKEKIIKIIKIILPAFLILILAPIIDLILSGGEGYNMAYFLPGIHENMVIKFLSFFGSFSSIGITPGIRMEVLVVLIGSFFYFYFKKNSFLKSIFSVILVYSVIFLYVSAPFIVKKAVEAFKMDFKFSDSLFINVYLLIILIGGIFLGYFTNKEYFKTIIKDIRFFRLIHYEAMFVLGLILGLRYDFFSIDCVNLFHFIFIPISIAFAWIFSVMVNNIEDYEIDKISNQERPLIEGKIRPDVYKKICWIFLIAAFVCSLSVSFQAFFIILLFIGNYFLYSAGPLRLKKITFLSKSLIALNSLILFIMGFVIITHSVYYLPAAVMPLFLIIFTITLNFIDIKDYEGDKKNNIKTLPVVLGLKKAKFVIGLFFILGHLLFYFLVKELIVLEKTEKIYLVFYLLIFGIIQFYFINKEKYEEKKIFLIYFLSVITFIFFIL